MLGFAIQQFCAAHAARPSIQVQVRTVPRGSWRWQDAYRVQIVRCPANERPDCRRRDHTLVSIPARKVGGKRNLRDAIALAERWAREFATEASIAYVA